MTMHMTTASRTETITRDAVEDSERVPCEPISGATDDRAGFAIVEMDMTGRPVVVEGCVVAPAVRGGGVAAGVESDIQGDWTKSVIGGISRVDNE
ncbi:hypothetical protein TRAPUB_5915 [Trametes pubescens]|uniref:Uncharacterized protein n=1 Tax=Trametes pubescens TaxID=154538 RepID=A0A1M2V750_TRAPU|nr:hypothetical protein TRAPUB_5915 [Trametes pubescens]